MVETVPKDDHLPLPTIPKENPSLFAFNPTTKLENLLKSIKLKKDFSRKVAVLDSSA